MLVQQRIAQYAAVWVRMQTYMQVGTQVKRTQQHASFLNPPVATKHVVFFSSVSSSFSSRGFHFRHFNVCDTDKQD